MFQPEVVLSDTLQTELNQDENFPQPVNIMDADVASPDVMRAKRALNHEFSRRVKAKSNATVEDIEKISDQDIAFGVASLIPNIARNIGAFNLQPLIEMMTAMQIQMTTAFNQMTTRLDQIDDKLFNSSAHNDTDVIRPPSNNNGDLIPVALPRNVLSLRTLNSRGCTACENYYNIIVPVGARLAARRSMIQRILNVDNPTFKIL